MSKTLLRSIGAVLAGLAAVVVLSTVTDLVLQALGVFPPSGQPMQSPLLFLLALAYRIAFGVAGGWITARLAPKAPTLHAVVLGSIGTALSIAGVAATLGRPEFGPAWYPIALVVTALPSVWLGARLRKPAR